jgi:hypothetical protein
MTQPSSEEIAAFLERISARLCQLADEMLRETEHAEQSDQSSSRTQAGGSLAGNDSSEASSTGS